MDKKINLSLLALLAALLITLTLYSFNEISANNNADTISSECIETGCPEISLTSEPYPPVATATPTPTPVPVGAYPVRLPIIVK